MPSPSLPGGYRLIALETVDSTNSEIRKLAQSGEATSFDKTVVWSLAQTGGQGRRGRNWASPVGNLYCSTILCLDRPAKEISLLSFVVALAVHDTVTELLPLTNPANVSCKWPNDVLINGKKISGILLESSGLAGKNPEWIVIGVGINVLSFPRETPYPASSLLEEGYGGKLEAVLERYIANLDQRLSMWKKQGFPKIRTEWLDRAMGLGDDIMVNLGDESLLGVFSDLDGEGALILDQAGTKRLITAGDVFPVQSI